MKKLFLIAVFSLVVLGAAAEIKFQSLDNLKGTNVVLVDEDAPQTIHITDAVLSNNGSDYSAKQIRCDIVNGVATYKLKFKRLTLFKDCKVTLTVNGEKLTINLQKSLLQK
ncbi:MAG: hypothetical protein K2N05_08990 [Muribaculaceae bacterium]|nr:hypothetical protein [Muribaculaceae bacterium]